MNEIYESVESLIGNTPLLKLKKIISKYDLNANVFAKVESFNPLSSIKDRAAYYMIKDAESKGLIDSETVIIEPTSGNTGVGLASICASKGYKLILTMPETMSNERKMLLKALGAEIVLTDGSKGMKGSIDKVEDLKREFGKVFVPNQFNNESNIKSHYETTAPEIYESLNGKVDAIVCGVGSGGTIAGIAKFFKEKSPETEIIAVEPENSAVLSGECAGAHKIQGIGAGFVPGNLENYIKLIDKIIKVSDEEAYEFTNSICKTEGLLCGISSGGALCGAVKYLRESGISNKNIVVIFPDTGERYLSTGVFN